ncbi:cytochrome c biogenesis protein [Niabella ginsengisoli]|uniref:Cytochrome c biogenesis protein n=1 Tax=Niabella ginsengisoli TaxID=522298 RepID=A0ABS9SLC7_9BACT|nr:cytochrome c biogenesis protein [Niabella ginsengisoli]MCH5599091.1 cytochrome c biogenesis protein [Niabella ginsengisoli]
MRKSWWKILCVILLVYAIAGGLLVKIPNAPLLEETSRNLFYHVGMWAAMFVLFTCSLVHSIRYLSKSNLKNDIAASQYASMGIVFGLLGYITGAVWASYTWADPNNPGFSFSTIAREPKLIGTAIALLIYFAYFILRSSIQDMDQKARITAVYNIFAFAMLFPTIMIVPRLLPSLHPGQEGNPALNFKDVSPEMRMIEYPAFIGWALLAVWITTLKIRINYIKEKHFIK